MTIVRTWEHLSVKCQLLYICWVEPQWRSSFQQANYKKQTAITYFQFHSWSEHKHLYLQLLYRNHTSYRKTSTVNICQRVIVVSQTFQPQTKSTQKYVDWGAMRMYIIMLSESLQFSLDLSIGEMWMSGNTQKRQRHHWRRWILLLWHAEPEHTWAWWTNYYFLGVCESLSPLLHDNFHASNIAHDNSASSFLCEAAV